MLPLADGWEDRAKLKLICTAVATALVSGQHAIAHHRSLLLEVPRKVFGYSAAAAVFCAVQETLRAARGNQDALNSLVAGAVAGAAAAGYYQGPQYRLLAAVLWGPICGGAHALNDLLQPRPLIEDWLISEGLLDPIIKERRTVPPSSRRADELYRQAAQGTTMDDLIEEATRVRDRELMELLGLRPAGGASVVGPSAAAAAAAGTSHAAHSDPERRGVGTGVAPGSPPAGGWAARAAAGQQQQQQQQQQGRQGPAAATASGRGEAGGGDGEGVEGEDFDEEDFKRWLAASRAAGASAILLDDEPPMAGSRGAAAGQGTGDEGRAPGRSWWVWEEEGMRVGSCGTKQLGNEGRASGRSWWVWQQEGVRVGSGGAQSAGDEGRAEGI